MMHSMGASPEPFQTHIALALQLIALVSGVLLINKAASTDFFCKKTGKIVGGFVVLAALLSIVCIATLSFKRCCHEEERSMPHMPSNWQHPPIDMPMDHPMPPPASPKMPKPQDEK
ncbi:MAG TPA: hypothetical protein VLJ37_10095 [bacterium]|nr:hypothetical protein [bacterium]